MREKWGRQPGETNPLPREQLSAMMQPLARPFGRYECWPMLGPIGALDTLCAEAEHGGVNPGNWSGEGGHACPHRTPTSPARMIIPVE